MRVFILTTALCCPALLPAYGAQRDPTPPARGTASISGRVIAADTGTPIRENVVTLTALQRDSILTTRTDTEGRFRFTELPSGRYRLQVKPGPTSARYLTEEQIVELAEKQHVEKIELKMRRAGAISGRVHDDVGDPIALTRIRVFRVEAGRPREFTHSVAFGSLSHTDDAGRFRVFGLAPGDYIIAADPASLPYAGDAAVPSRQLMTYYPGTPNAAEATRLTVAHGAELSGIDMPIVRGGTYRITGTVIDSRGQPLADTFVLVMAREGDSGFSGSGVKTAADGTFTARNVAAGDYFLVVKPLLTTKAMPAGSEFAVQAISVSGDVEGVALTTRPGATITGRVSFDGDRPPARVSVIPMFVDRQPRPTGLPPSSPVADDGAFRLEHVFGPALLRVSGAAGWYIDTVTVDGKEITDTPIDFGTATSDVVITMAKRGATLAGVALDSDGKPTSDAMVVLFGETESAWQPRHSATRTATVEADGRFSLSPVRPGKYFAVAVPRQGLRLDTTTSADFERLAKSATKVELRDGQSQTVTLTVVAPTR
jgi:protocatechuate 3,4-dioxygenase beta subunit